MRAEAGQPAGHRTVCRVISAVIASHTWRASAANGATITSLVFIAFLLLRLPSAPATGGAGTWH